MMTSLILTSWSPRHDPLKVEKQIFWHDVMIGLIVLTTSDEQITISSSSRHDLILDRMAFDHNTYFPGGFWSDSHRIMIWRRIVFCSSSKFITDLVGNHDIWWIPFHCRTTALWATWYPCRNPELQHQIQWTCIQKSCVPIRYHRARRMCISSRASILHFFITGIVNVPRKQKNFICWFWKSSIPVKSCSGYIHRRAIQRLSYHPWHPSSNTLPTVRSSSAHRCLWSISVLHHDRDIPWCRTISNHIMSKGRNVNIAPMGNWSWLYLSCYMWSVLP